MRIQQEQRAAAARKLRTYRVGGVIAVAILAVVIAIVVSSSSTSTKPKKITSSTATAAQTTIAGWLAGTTQSGLTWGSPNAPVTVKSYIDPQCSACDEEFVGPNRTGGPFTQIASLIRAGQLKIQFLPLQSVTPSASMLQQEWAAVMAAAQQGKGIEFLFTNYLFQPGEYSGQFNQAYINQTAQATQGLDYTKWRSAQNSASVQASALSAVQEGNATGYNTTPTSVITSAKGQRGPLVGAYPASAFQQAYQQLRP